MRFKLSFIFALGVLLDQYYLLERYPFSPFICFVFIDKKIKKRRMEGKRRQKRRGGEGRGEEK